MVFWDGTLTNVCIQMSVVSLTIWNAVVDRIFRGEGGQENYGIQASALVSFYDYILQIGVALMLNLTTFSGSTTALMLSSPNFYLCKQGPLKAVAAQQTHCESRRVRTNRIRLSHLHHYSILDDNFWVAHGCN